MGWWSAFERSEVAADFSRIAASGFDSVRLFLTWEDFQPTPDSVDPQMIERLVDTLRARENRRAFRDANAFHRPHERSELDSAVGAG